ncbi:MAG TPA: TetR/AcrR family transcriptional regulator [Symbiobacteriaceae bacterium]|nr:TetR/AcrR family transcriptional regulator [Symbiobacteriaceae bacterium]
MNEKRMTSREIQAEARRNQLIDTALTVFAEKGVENATTKDLAEAAGVAQGLMYHYFRSKEDLLLAVMEKHGFMPDLRRILAVGHDRPAAAVLLEIALGFQAMLENRQPLVRVVFREAWTNPDVGRVLGGMIHEAAEGIARYLAARVAAGELRPHNPDVAARTFLHSIFMANLTRVPMAIYIPEMVENVLKGLEAR